MSDTHAEAQRRSEVGAVPRTRMKTLLSRAILIISAGLVLLVLAELTVYGQRNAAEVSRRVTVAGPSPRRPRASERTSRSCGGRR